MLSMVPILFWLGLFWHILSIHTTVLAQPAVPACEDQVRVFRALVDQYARADAQGKLEAAREIAELRKALEIARAAAKGV